MFRIAFLILCSSLPSLAAGGLYINGVRSDGLTNLKLHNVDLEIDANGDLHITAKGYNVNVAEPVKPARPAPPPSGRNTPQPTRYVLTMAQNGDPQWDIDVYINGQYVRRFQAGMTSAPVDVTKLMKPGDNSVRFHAVKQEGQVRSIQPNEFLQLSVDADQALANGRHELTHIYSYKRTAAETGLFDDSVSVSVR